MSTSVSSTSPDETRAFGRRLAAALQAGDVIALEGELGSGKTELVRGIADGLEVTGTVHSPTFVLHHRYRGRLPVEHFDLYRLEGMAWVDTGLDEPAPDAVTLIEWPERAAVLEAWATTLIRLKAGGETERVLTLLRGPDRIREVFERAPGD
jgi:tRNA threonylcarbamoyladenosine biosynthesis protein TsaE